MTDTPKNIITSPLFGAILNFIAGSFCILLGYVNLVYGNTGGDSILGSFQIILSLCNFAGAIYLFRLWLTLRKG